jgi:predicted nucleic acid-binding Zn ribbon protein
MRRQKRTIDFNIKAAVKDALHRLNLDTRMKGYAVWGIWTKAVGDTIAQQAQPSFVRGGILFVKCSSSAWIQQLHFMKGTIRDALNRLLGSDVIKDIRFQMGVISSPAEVAPVVEEQEVVLDDADRKRIDEALHPLVDLEMKEIARRIMVKETTAKKSLTR